MISTKFLPPYWQRSAAFVGRILSSRVVFLLILFWVILLQLRVVILFALFKVSYYLNSRTKENTSLTLSTVPTCTYLYSPYREITLLTSGVRDCSKIIRRGGGRKMSFARRNSLQYPPLNKGKLALTPLQISQKIMTHPPPQTTTYKYSK